MRMSGEIERVVRSRGFWGGVFLAAAAIAFGISYPDKEALKELLSAGTFLSLVQNALFSRTVSFLFPVIAVLPWSNSFLEEWKSGFLKFSILRSGKRNYIESKIVAVALAGLLVWGVAAVFVVSGTFFFYFPHEARGKIGIEMAEAFGFVILRFGLLGSIVSILGGICAVISESIYMAWGLPFVFWYFGIILKERYFEEAFWLYPPEWLKAEVFWGENNMGLWLFLLVLLLAGMGIFGGVLYRKLEEVQ